MVDLALTIGELSAEDLAQLEALAENLLLHPADTQWGGAIRATVGAAAHLDRQEEEQEPELAG